jgi:hypothetical protein
MGIPLLAVELKGGLGNQLFQIAAGYAYAKRFAMELCFPRMWNCRSDRQPIWDTYFKDSQHKFSLLEKSSFETVRWHTISEERYAYKEIPAPPRGLPFYKLNGYFQSSKYFQAVKEEIRDLLHIPLWLAVEANTQLDRLQVDPDEDWIGAHVRRGDYIYASDYHVTTTKEYFEGARSHIQRNTGYSRVCWITEDPQWVSQTLAKEGDEIISGDALSDFATLAKFKHLILSNSSYSWWAAWLNPLQHKSRIICAPNKWFGPKGPQDFATIFEPDWTLIDTTSGNVVAHVDNQV